MKLNVDDIEKILVDRVEEFGINSRSLFVKNDLSDKLLIILSTHNQRNTFFAVKKILSEFSTNILFLTDYNNSYYLENCSSITDTSYYKYIEKYVKIYGSTNIFIFGSSMAGYAAIKYGEVLDLNIIAMNPQLSIEVSYQSAWPDLRNTFSQITHFQDIDFKRIKNRVFLVFSEHPMDKANYAFFVESTTDIPIKSTVQRISTNEHNFPYADTPNIIFEIIDFLNLI